MLGDHDLIRGQFGILAVVSATAAWLYWSKAASRGRAVAVIAAAFLWAAVVARVVVELMARAGTSLQSISSEPLTQFVLGLFELGILATVIVRRARK